MSSRTVTHSCMWCLHALNACGFTTCSFLFPLEVLKTQVLALSTHGHVLQVWVSVLLNGTAWEQQLTSYPVLHM